jgi:hypothetical protein
MNSPDQPSFDFSRARAERDAAIQRAQEHADRVEPSWSDSAYALLQDYARRTPSFTAEAFRLYVERGNLLPVPPDKRAWGGTFQRASRARLIKREGFVQATDPRVHCNIVALWRSLVYQDVAA